MLLTVLAGGAALAQDTMSGSHMQGSKMHAGAMGDNVSLAVNGSVHVFGDDGTRIATVTALAREAAPLHGGNA